MPAPAPRSAIGRTQSKTTKKLSFEITEAIVTHKQVISMCRALCLATSSDYSDMASRIIAEAKKRPVIEILKMPALRGAIKRPNRTNLSSQIASLSQGSADGAEEMEVDSTPLPTIAVAPTAFDPTDLNSVFNPDDPNLTIKDLAMAIHNLHQRCNRSDFVVKKVYDNVDMLGDALKGVIEGITPLTNKFKSLRNEVNVMSKHISNMEEDLDGLQDISTLGMQALTEDHESLELTVLKNKTTLGYALKAVETVEAESALTVARAVEAEKIALDSSKRTEFIDRELRRKNIMVMGWPVQDGKAPIDDARDYLAAINAVPAESFTARRLPQSVRDVEVRPGLLCISFNSSSTAARVLEMGRKHAGGRRDLPFFSRPDQTKEQEVEKKRADAGIRLL